MAAASAFVVVFYHRAMDGANAFERRFAQAVDGKRKAQLPNCSVTIGYGD